MFLACGHLVSEVLVLSCLCCCYHYWVGRGRDLGNPGWPLLDLALEVLAGYQVRDVVIIGIGVLSVLGHVLVALGQLSKGGEGVGTQLVKDARHELGELLVLTISVNSESVGGDSGVHWTERKEG